MQASEAEKISQRFLAARRAADGMDDYPGPLPSSLSDAYAIQDAAITGWQRQVIGWKVGRINAPLSDHFETDRLAGPIFVSRTMPDDAQPITMPVFERGFAAGEAEFLLRIGHPPPVGRTGYSIEDVYEHIDAVHVGIEIASSPLRTINDIGPIAIVSDFGNNNGLLIGPEIAQWRESRFEEWPVTTLIDGVEVGSGKAASFPSGALGAARFLFELMARRGIALERGQWISSGAVTGVHSARPGQLITAQFNDQFTVECRLVAADPE